MSCDILRCDFLSIRNSIGDYIKNKISCTSLSALPMGQGGTTKLDLRKQVTRQSSMYTFLGHYKTYSVEAASYLATNDIIDYQNTQKWWNKQTPIVSCMETSSTGNNTVQLIF